MNLTPCPEGKHIWANVMPNGGNAVRSQGTTVGDLGILSKSASVYVLEKFSLAIRERGHSPCPGTTVT